MNHFRDLKMLCVSILFLLGCTSSYEREEGKLYREMINKVYPIDEDNSSRFESTDLHIKKDLKLYIDNQGNYSIRDGRNIYKNCKGKFSVELESNNWVFTGFNGDTQKTGEFCISIMKNGVNTEKLCFDIRSGCSIK